MPRFIYTPAKEFDGTDMPPFTEMFGIRFVEDMPKEVLPVSFRTDAEFKHAVSKLSVHKHFKLVDDSPGAVEVMEEPKAKRGRKPKAVEPVAEEAVELPADVE